MVTKRAPAEAARCARVFKASGYALAALRSQKAPPAASPAGRVLERAPFSKADLSKHVTSGVVLDPYVVDLQQDWVPPNDVEDCAWSWLRKWSVVGADHDHRIEAWPVESFCLPYPTQGDYEAACALQPHRAWELPFGEDVLHSGAWVLSVLYGDAEWPRVLSGEYAAYSIRGFGEREDVSPAAMPEVTFLRCADLLPRAS